MFRVLDYVYCLGLNQLGRIIGGLGNGLVVVSVDDGQHLTVYLVSVDMLQYVCLN